MKFVYRSRLALMSIVFAVIAIALAMGNAGNAIAARSAQVVAGQPVAGQPVAQQPRQAEQAQQATAAPTVQETEPEEVMYYRPAIGKIVDPAFQQAWTFVPDSKDRITITVDRTSDTLVPEVELHDEQDKVVVKADHDATFAHAGIVNFTLTAPGRYTVVVSRVDGKAGKTFGSYKLVVALLGTGADGMNPTVSEGNLTLRQSRDGTLNEAKWEESWTIKTQTADPVTVIVSRLKGTLVPQVSLMDAKFNPVATGQLDASFSTVGITKFAVSGPGQVYFVVVSRLDGTNGGTTGDYRLLVVQGQQQ